MQGLNKLKPHGQCGASQSWSLMRPPLQLQKKGVAGVVRNNVVVGWADMEANIIQVVNPFNLVAYRRGA